MMVANEVTDLIGALRSGEMSLDEVAAQFRRSAWRRTRRPAPQTSAEFIDVPLSDPGANVPGSMDEVTAAYDRGEITREQYRALAHAVADAINAGRTRSAD